MCGLNWVSDATRSIDEIKHVSQYVPSRILAGRGVTVEQARSAVTAGRQILRGNEMCGIDYRDARKHDARKRLAPKPIQITTKI